MWRKWKQSLWWRQITKESLLSWSCVDVYQRIILDTFLKKNFIKSNYIFFYLKILFFKKDIFLFSRYVTVYPFYHTTMITSKAKMYLVEILFLMQVPAWTELLANVLLSLFSMLFSGKVFHALSAWKSYSLWEQKETALLKYIKTYMHWHNLFSFSHSCCCFYASAASR